MTLVGARRRRCRADTGRRGLERIHAFLRDNVGRNSLTNVVAMQCGSGGRSQVKEFYEAPLEKFGKGSLAPQYFQPPTMVPTRTLDSLLEEVGMPVVNVLKVDVEGFEAAVLRGASRLLEAKEAPWVLFEFEDWSETRAHFPPGCAQDVLRDKGYSIAQLSVWLEKRTLLKAPVAQAQCWWESRRAETVRVRASFSWRFIGSLAKHCARG